MTRQLADFKTGARHPSVGITVMTNISRALTPQERDAALTYYSPSGSVLGEGR
jgi:hypothetical protein